MTFCALIALCTIFLAYGVSGQEVPMLHYTTENGLPSNTVYQVYRSSSGHLWFSTDKGVARYSSQHFETFTTFDGMADNEVFFVQEDKNQRLWLGTYNGDLCYFKNDSFHTARNTPFLRLPFKMSYVKHITVEFDSSILINYPAPKRFIEIKNDRLIVRDAGPQINNSLGAYIYKRKIAPDRYELTTNKQVIITDTLLNIIQKMAGREYRIFSSSQNQEYLFNLECFWEAGKTDLFLFPPHFHENFTLLQIFKDGNTTFFGTTNGLIINDSIHILKGIAVSAITRDISGNYWVSTLTDGVYCLGKNIFNGKLYRNVYDGKAVYSYADPGHVYFGTNRNRLYSVSDNKVKALPLALPPFNKNAFEPCFVIGKDYSFFNFYNREVSGTPDIRRNHARITSRKTKQYEGAKTAVIASGNLFVRCITGVVVQPVPDVVNTPDRALSIPRAPKNTERIFWLTHNDSGTPWYSTITNLFAIESGIETEQPPLKNITFKVFCFIGNYLVGYTFDNKLLVCNLVDKTVFKDSVTGQNCIWEKFYQLDTTHLLISTNNSYRVLSLYPSAGVPKKHLAILENPFVPLNAESICSDGTHCYFLKNGSVTAIDIKTLLQTIDPPVLVFSQLRTVRKIYPVQSEIELPFKESKNLKISFAALSFSSKDVRYQYAVSKTDAFRWIDLTGEEITLVNPGYGEYTVKIRARTLSSEFSDPVSFKMTISPPYWAKWWFTMLVVAGALIFLTVIVLIIIRLVLDATKRKNMRMELELKAVYAQINPHFIFNTLNSALLLVSKQKMEEAYAHISKFSRLLRSYLKSSRNKLISIAEEISNLEDYIELQQTRFKNKFEYRIDYDTSIDLKQIMIPSLLLQPFVENAINHGILPRRDSGLLSIAFDIHLDRNEMTCTVADNGIGRKNAQLLASEANIKDASYGDLLIRDLVSIFNKYEQMNINITYFDKDEPDTGTVVTIHIKNLRYDK